MSEAVFNNVLPEQGTLLAGNIMLGSAVVAALVACFIINAELTTTNGNGSGNGESVEERDIGGGAWRDEACPVCLNEFTYPVKTKCGHSFCAQCLLTHLSHDQRPRAARCPVCRREVTLLLASEELRTATTAEGQRLRSSVTEYNQRMSKKWRRYGRILINNLHLLLIAVVMLIYSLSPFGLIPESVLGVIIFLFSLILAVLSYIVLTKYYRARLANHRPI